MKLILALIVLSSCVLFSALATTKEMRRYELFCIYKTLNIDDQFFGSYVVSGFNEKGMALQIFSPTNNLIEKIEREREGAFFVNVTEEGEYRACFRNLEKDLAFITFEIHAPASDSKGRAVGSGDIQEITAELRDLVRTIRQVRTNLSFQEWRDRVHTNNLQTLVSRMEWSTFIKIVILVLFGAAQLYVLTGFFKRKLNKISV